MAEQWKALGHRAINALIAASAQPLGPSFGIASAALSARTTQMETLAGGPPVDWDSVVLDGPAARLEQAMRALESYNELVHRVFRVLSVYGKLLGVITDGALWQSWAQSKDDALHYNHQVSQRLRSVAAYDLATVDAFTVARSFPDNSPASVAWMRAAKILAVRAKAEAGAMTQSQANMCSAVHRVCHYGRAILPP